MIKTNKGSKKMIKIDVEFFLLQRQEIDRLKNKVEILVRRMGMVEDSNVRMKQNNELYLSLIKSRIKLRI